MPGTLSNNPIKSIADKTADSLNQMKEELEARVFERTSSLEKLTQELEAEINDRKLVEQELRQSEERYRTLYEEVPVGLFQVSPQGEFMAANSVLLKMLGVDSLKTFLAGKPEDYYVLPQSHRLFLNAIIKDGSVQQKTLQYRRADGSSFWGELNAQAIYDDHGKTLYFQGSIQNVSGRIDAEIVQNAVYRISEAAASTQNLEDLYPLVHTIIGELIPADNFYIALFDPTTDTITFPYYVDQSDDPVSPNQIYTMQEMERGLTWHLIRSGQPILLTQGAFKTLIEQGEVSRIGELCEEYLGVPLKTPTGEIIGAIAAQTYVPGETYSIHDQEMLSFVSTQIAIAIVRKRAEETLQLQVEALDSTVNNIAVVDLNGKILWANRAFCLFTGIPLEEMEKHSIQGVCSDPANSRAFEEIFEQIDSRQSWQGELIFTHEKGDVFTHDVSFTPVRSKNNSQITRYIAVLRDITYRKRTEILEQDRGQVMELIAQDSPIDTILETIVQMVEHQRGGLSCTIYLQHNGVFHRAAGVKQNLLGKANQDYIDENSMPDIWNKVILNQEKVIYPAADQENGEIFYLAPIQSGRGEMLGALAVASLNNRPFSRVDSIFFDNVSHLAAMAIERVQMNDRLVHLAMYDSLTGLPNRHLLEDRLKQSFSQAQRTNTYVGLAFLDLTHFKDVNESLGHPIGDLLIQQMAQRLLRAVRQSDTLAHLGGDDFVIILNNLKDPSEASKVIEKLMDVVKPIFHVEEHELFLNANIGYSIYPQDGEDVNTLLMNADSALAYSKSSDKTNMVRFEPFMNTMVIERLSIVSRLRRAVEQDEFVLHYQPEIDLTSGKVLGLEALLRWQVPGVGMIPPDNFIPIAEESGLIHAIGNWVIREVCRQLAEWKEEGLNIKPISVNVSPKQFYRSDFLDQLLDAIHESGLSPENIAIEITESVFLHDIMEVAERLQRVSDLGIEVHIDDFGKAYSSLSYLKNLPVKCLKIDKTFIDDLISNSDARVDHAALVKAIITLGHSLHLMTLAEGVETQAQLNILKSLNCDRAQGYLLSHPLPSEEAKKLFDLQ